MSTQFAKRLIFFAINCCMVLLFLPQESRAFFIKNGGFESGDLSEWIVFETPNGSLGGEGFPNCVDFDVTGNGKTTKSAEFKVGQVAYQANGDPLAGGGIYRTLYIEAGILKVMVDIAVSYSSPADRRNLAGGLFELLLDGRVIASHDFGPIPNNSIQRTTLEGRARISGGMHELRIRMRRPFRSLRQDQAPRQYLDNIQLTLSAP